MGLGAVSFVHVVKAAEPVFAAILSAIFAGSVMAFPVYASLLPVCAGVAIASAGELSFSVACFSAAMMSNLLFAARAVFSKMAMSSADQGQNMDAANTFAVVTMLATLVCIPVALVLEGSKIPAAWAAATAVKGMTAKKLATTLFMSGIYLYTYNECGASPLNPLSLLSFFERASCRDSSREFKFLASHSASPRPRPPPPATGRYCISRAILFPSDHRHAAPPSKRGTVADCVCAAHPPEQSPSRSWGWSLLSPRQWATPSSVSSSSSPPP